MKNFLLTAVIAASAAMPVMAGTALPYSETFDTAADFATMTVSMRTATTRRGITVTTTSRQ